MAFDDGIKTVSGSVAHTDDAATKVPFVSVKCGIEPTLTGVSLLTVTQTGESLANIADVSGSMTNAYFYNIGTDYTLTADVTYKITMVVNSTVTPFAVSVGVGDNAYRYDIYNTGIVNQNGIVSFEFTPNSSHLATWKKLWIRAPRYSTPQESHQTTCTFIVTNITLYTSAIVYTASLGRTIYGGQADIVNGTGQETYGEPWTWTAGMSGVSVNNNGVCYINKSDVVTVNASNQTTLVGCICSDTSFVSRTWAGLQNATANGCACVYGNGIAIKMPGYTTKQEYETYLTNNPLTFVYMLKTPTDFTFTPITPTPETVGNVNNVYCNTGDTELTYHDNAHGFAEVTVNKTGRNLIDQTKYNQDNSSRLTIGQTRSNANRDIHLKKGTYTITVTCPEKTPTIYYTTGDGNISLGNTTASRSFTLSEDSDCSFWLYLSGILPSDFSTIQLEYGSTAHAYEPYEAVSKTAYLHKVIYGGKADVIRGTCEPKNLLKNLGTFPYTLSATEQYYSEFANAIVARKIPLIALENGVSYTLSLDVQCSTEPFYMSIGVGDGRYLRDIHNSGATLTSGRVSVTFTPTGLTEGNNYLAFRVPRYGSKKDYDVTVDNVQLEKASSATDFAPYFDPFTFPPISMETDEGENTLFANEGDSAITYRKEI